MAQGQSFPKRKRTRLLVDTEVQGAIVRQIATHWLLACFLMFLYLFVMQVFANGFTLTFGENIQQLFRSYGLLAVVLGVISPVFIYDTVKLSHRFTGPMVSFRTALKKLAQGEDPGPVKFRKDDFWHDLSNDLNGLTKELQTLRASSPTESDSQDEKTEETVTA